MAGEWKKNPLVRIALVAIIVIIALSFFLHPQRGNGAAALGVRIQESVGFVAAEEAAKILGDKGGAAVCIFEERLFDAEGSRYERGFQQAAAKNHVRLLGHYLVRMPLLEQVQTDQGPRDKLFNGPSLTTLQTVREKFPSTDLLISFVNLPQLSDDEIAQWMASSPPKLIVFQQPILSQDRLDRAVSRGLVESLLVHKEKVSTPEKMPRDPHQLFDIYYYVLQRAGAK